MKVVIIGNNVSGTFSAQNIRFLSKDAEIDVYTQEEYPYYTRVNLPELISEKVSIEDLIVFKNDWYENKNIQLNLNTYVNSINPKNKTIEIDSKDNPVSYDKLILALGSTPNVPPIKNAIEMKNEEKGVFTLRSIKDALAIKDFIRKNKAEKAIVIGGGL
ncbi:MAG: FAD-dependent oxidoreductase, partial [Candidatus Heimdallarchaeota archaeon]